MSERAGLAKGIRALAFRCGIRLLADKQHNTVDYLMQYSDNYLTKILETSAMFAFNRRAARVTVGDVRHAMGVMGRRLDHAAIAIDRPVRRKDKNERPRPANFRKAESYQQAVKNHRRPA